MGFMVLAAALASPVAFANDGKDVKKDCPHCNEGKKGKKCKCGDKKKCTCKDKEEKAGEEKKAE
jgi:hypothetical protein